MPFNVGETINSLVDRFLKAPIVKSVATNPIYTALTMTFMVVIVIMIIFRNAETEDSLLVMCLRGGFYIMFMLLGTLFLHDRVLSSEHFAMGKNDDYEAAFNKSTIDDTIRVPISVQREPPPMVIPDHSTPGLGEIS